MSENKIEPGDFVRVYFQIPGGLIEGIVTYTPYDTGDAFHIRPVDLSGPNGWTNTRPIVYVQNYQTMQVIRKQLASPEDLTKMAGDTIF